MKTKEKSLLRKEGFWGGSEKDVLPWPISSEKSWKGKTEFLQNLRHKQTLADKEYYRGLSRCRLCGEHNGLKEYKLKNWCWPEGLIHYVKVHNVRPSLAFQEFTLGKHLKGY